MSLKPLFVIAATFSAAIVAAIPLSPAQANGYGGHGGGVYVPSTPICPKGNITINKPVTINKNVSIYKPITINKNISIDKSISVYKPVTINKNITINKTIDASKNISIVKNIDASKHIDIKKTIIINKGGKGGGSAEAEAFAKAFAEAQASAQASASAQANVTVYNGSYQYVTVNNKVGGDIDVKVEQQCEMQEAVVMKAIHAVCVAYGREFAATHMDSETFVNESYEGEVLRCIAGARLKVQICDVLQSDQGMAGACGNAQLIECQDGEALRHFKGGMLKCAPVMPVKDCTERTNLRKYGEGDLFFSYRTQVCISASRSASASASGSSTRELELNGLSLQGGVGESDSGY